MNPISPMKPISPLAHGSEPTTQVSDMQSLLDELCELVEGENRVLSDGIPASLSDTVGRKSALAGRLEACLQEMRSSRFQAMADPSEMAKLIDTLQKLRVLMGTNTAMIKRSIDSTHRRIDAIMKALRSEPGRLASYGADGLERRRSIQVANDRSA